MKPYEDGVIEIGNLRSKPQWEEIPVAANMPKVELRKAFEEQGALYALFWKQTGDEFSVVADYENPRDRGRRLTMRGDGESFVKLLRPNLPALASTKRNFMGLQLP